jgi:hypothetical protein
MLDLGGIVERSDVHGLRVEDLLDLVADEVVHGLHVEVLGEALLDAVDDRQFRGPLVGFRQQPLRLIEQPGVLQRNTQARSQSRQQADVSLAECGIPVDVLKGDASEYFAATDKRREHDRFGRLARCNREFDTGLFFELFDVVDDEGLASLAVDRENASGRVADGRRLFDRALAFFE